MGDGLAGRRLYLCTGDHPDLAQFLGACIRGGVDLVQLRDKVLEARALILRARLARQVCHDHGVPFILNDRPDLAGNASEPVDYMSVGPVTPTPAKPGRPGTGLGYVAHAAEHYPRPFFVTGGVTPRTLPAMVTAGGRRFVVVRWLTEAGNPEQAARALRAALDEALASLPAG